MNTLMRIARSRGRDELQQTSRSEGTIEQIGLELD
jgi:hypothetical protein